LAFHGRLAAASIAQACALVLLLASSVAPANARVGIVVAALISSIIARILLAIRGSGNIWSVRHWRERRLSLNRRWIFVALAIGAILILGSRSR